MDGSLALEITGDTGIFRHGDAYHTSTDELDAALDSRETGNVTEAKYLAVLKSIVERHPNFIDGHAHLGYTLLEQGKPKLALEACLCGLRLGERAIPAGFPAQSNGAFSRIGRFCAPRTVSYFANCDSDSVEMQ